MSSTDSVIDSLHAALHREAGLSRLLEQSLTQARSKAEAELDRDLFDALEWHSDISGYEDYLNAALMLKSVGAGRAQGRGAAPFGATTPR